MTTATGIGRCLVQFLVLSLAFNNVEALAPVSSRGLLTNTISVSQRTSCLCRNSKKLQPWSLQAAKDNDGGKSPLVEDDDDDGWGDDVVVTSELKALQDQRQNRQLSSQSSQSSDASSSSDGPDLFIPIFTLVAVVGFGGLYFYETVRLYMNGELYLPGGN